ncbi:MAG: single-stranded-DNA-specific exonuclease RecJ [Saccharofermentans sp.]|nr:single-stranded-DNA-specific exonuclease RecJ [Saccharofermentans sp.]
MLLTSKRWHTSEFFDKNDSDALVDVLLKSRNINTAEEKEDFLQTDGGIWHDPFKFVDMDKAVDIIVHTIEAGEKILVYGDYDCDGVTATTILVRYFRSHGCDVEYIVPHRAEHGYGLTENILSKVLLVNPALLITVDCGITNFDTIAKIKESGIKIIVSDHHNVKDELPCADVVICAKRDDNTYPFKDLCGAGVALKIVEALGRDGRYKLSPSIWRQSIELAGIATIADLVSVVDENRTIIKKAFKSMSEPVNLGVRIMNSMLLDNGKRLDETFISFNFVPRINAAGRLYDSSDALKLFLSDDEMEVRQAAEDLGKQNDERKKIEADVFSEAVRQVEDVRRPEEWLLTNTCGPIVVYGPNWHQGVLGIVAGKLAQYFRRSAIVFTNDSIEPQNVKGSGRAFGEYDLYGALTEIQEACVNFGGHKKAAGLVVEKKRLGVFMKALEENARQHIKDFEDTDDVSSDDDENALEINVRIPFDSVSFDTYEKINVLKPFGIGNRKPIFSTENLIITELASMSNGAHIRLELSDGSENPKSGTISAVGFGMGQYGNVLKVGDRVNLAYTMNEYTYRGSTSLSLYIEDIVPIYGDSFMWNKAETAEKLYTSGLGLDQVSKLAKCSLQEGFVPSQAHYTACYKTLDANCREGISTVDVDLLARMIMIKSGVEITPFQVKRCLEVFSEAGLMKLGSVGPLRVCFSFLKNDGKVQLAISDTYKRFKTYG